MYKKILIANRGLIQANCVRAVKELGAQAITIYESEDRDSTGVRNADEAFELKANIPGQAYFNIDTIVEIATREGVDAVHPGYGFLAQNQDLIKRLREKGIDTIAPDIEKSSDLANKPAIKAEAQKAGLPVLPGSQICSSFADVQTAANELGYPLVIKAVYGYGGKGMVKVLKEADLQSAFERVQAQCDKFAMNSGEVFLEKFIGNAHHVELPVLRDTSGNTLVFPEQECSIQRRFQKLVVETPSIAINAEQREKLRTVVASLVSRLNVKGFASVEFLVENGQPYFLEVNGYIQPSHTASSVLTGVDLLKEQIRLYSGESLNIQQNQLSQLGHVISVYIAAEDPTNHFAPSPGKVDRFYTPFGEGVFIQTNVHSGHQVTTHFDPMIAKVMVRDTNRENAIAKMRTALNEFYVDGIRTNISLMRGIMKSNEFTNGQIDISFISSAEHREEVSDLNQTLEEAELASAIAALSVHIDSSNQQMLEAARAKSESSIWSAAARWINRK